MSVRFDCFRCGLRLEAPDRDAVVAFAVAHPATCGTCGHSRDQHYHHTPDGSVRGCDECRCEQFDGDDA